MVGPVVDRNLEIDHGVAGQVALFGGFDDTLFHRRNEVLGDGSAEDLVGKLKLSASRQGFHLDPAVAELAVAPGLLLVAALYIGGPPNGLPVGDFWCF